MIDTKKLRELADIYAKARMDYTDAEPAGWCIEQAELFAELDHLTAENEALRKDAERYRWLRSEGFDRPAVMWVMTVRDKTPVVHTDLDAAIDAIRASKGEA